jgi:hypothetical protein
MSNLSSGYMFAMSFFGRRKSRMIVFSGDFRKRCEEKPIYDFPYRCLDPGNTCESQTDFCPVSKNYEKSQWYRDIPNESNCPAKHPTILLSFQAMQG